MLSKESKIRVLENFYGIDYVFFGKPVGQIDNCCPVIKEEYVSIKGALLSVYLEMLRLMEHTPPVIEEKVDTLALNVMAKESAANARYASQKVVTTEAARKDIKIQLKAELSQNENANINTLVQTKIREKAFRLAVDNLLVARALSEATNLEAMNEWTGKIIEDSYKILRDNLCETAMMILYDESAE